MGCSVIPDGRTVTLRAEMTAVGVSCQPNALAAACPRAKIVALTSDSTWDATTDERNNPKPGKADIADKRDGPVTVILRIRDGTSGSPDGAGVRVVLRVKVDVVTEK